MLEKAANKPKPVKHIDWATEVTKIQPKNSVKKVENWFKISADLEKEVNQIKKDAD